MKILAKEDATKAEYDAALKAMNAAKKVLVTKDSLVKAGEAYKVQGNSYKVLKKADDCRRNSCLCKSQESEDCNSSRQGQTGRRQVLQGHEARSQRKPYTVKTKKLKKKSVKGSLKGSKVKTVQVKVGKKKVNKKYVKKYKKIFTKKNAGKKVMK